VKKRVNVVTVVVLMALTGLVTYVITFFSVQEDLNRQLETFRKWQNEWRSFTDALNNIENKFIGEAEQPALMQGAIEGLVKSTGDRWSRYFDPEAFAAHLGAQASPYVGIGVTVERDGGDGGFIKIIEVMDNAPAKGAGIQPGDLITHVDGLSVAEIGYDDAIAVIGSGEEYDLVTLTIERADEGSFTVDVMRRTVIRDRIKAETLRMPSGDIGVLRLLNFDDHVDTEFIAKVNELIEDGVTGLVFDVRGNPGGKLSVLEAMLDFLLPEGELITLKYKDGREDVRTSGPEHINLPMAVIIDENSVSAAEFFAACLREYEWAVLVGEKTHGKGYAQETIRLNDGSGLYLSTSEYFTSKGQSLDGVGLTPDVTVSLTEEERAHIGSMDPALDRQLARALQEVQ
jgi:carboxyl-terminal processing protease